MDESPICYLDSILTGKSPIFNPVLFYIVSVHRPPKSLVPDYNRLVSGGATTSWGGQKVALRWAMQTNGIPAGQTKGSGCVKSQTIP